MATIKVKQVRSRIRRPRNQKLNLDALGLKKVNQVVELQDTPQIRGMVYKVRHLVEVVE
ncbi:50S ribosomal protein L30 [Porphyromonas gingivicanis]|uniref:Large ribosomal subunit protein uL30 n=1 Tax=Porphyromonas gingivicanis TaxID=266762 RepID=A0A0A2G438_9PORP|nr:50S ribosomal protein L30 [Porphyromonas gingivicanis]KGN97217.1 50S ribosomal protein L30 [Porphyromonas gingivicanis]